MKREDINVYKLTHTHSDDEEDIFIHTNMPLDDLLKLTKVIQVKAFNIEDTYDLFPEEMKDVLLQYEGIRHFPTEEDISEIINKGDDGFDYIEEDLYMIWEASNIKVTDKDLNDPKYNNENALKLINGFIKEEN
jgi:hypothetical protein